MNKIVIQVSYFVFLCFFCSCLQVGRVKNYHNEALTQKDTIYMNYPQLFGKDSNYGGYNDKKVVFVLKNGVNNILKEFLKGTYVLDSVNVFIDKSDTTLIEIKRWKVNDFKSKQFDNKKYDTKRKNLTNNFLLLPMISFSSQYSSSSTGRLVAFSFSPPTYYFDFELHLIFIDLSSGKIFYYGNVSGNGKVLNAKRAKKLNRRLKKIIQKYALKNFPCCA